MNNSVLFLVGVFLVLVAAILWSIDTSHAPAYVLGIVGLVAAAIGAVMNLKYRVKN